MKKLIIAFAVVSATICANAAAVSWQASSVKGPDGKAVGKTTDVYSFVCTIFANDQTTVVGSNTSTSSNAMSTFSGTVDGTATSTSYYAQLIATNLSSGETFTSEKLAFTTDSSASYAVNFTTGNGLTGTPKINWADTGTWQAAPEPTSGLLLLLGVAGLALKRKRA